MQKRCKLPRAKSQQVRLGIKHTTPGAIAAAAIWVIFLFSGDEIWGPIGDVTAINYRDRFNEYLDTILEGLRRRQRWARELFLYWDEHVFPANNGARFGGGVGQDDVEVRNEIKGARRALLDMPVVSDSEASDSDDDR
ncbi:hypothetical protein GGX14DRAFT_391819 [Mycena pura]|uniref:Uncharacterized protein n=1 Tax=Mycena pura TaxID=153505 RepID=A0AAD6YDH9_9AGAR|nr:hypothetical protein GGX14DRAFT_391819 [Mycena pura]